MLNLLQPWWLIALGVIPLIRWLHRRQAPLLTHDVSAVFLWQDQTANDTAGQEQRPPDPAWRRRALIAALLVFALVGPVIEREQTILTVWVDDSLSMSTLEDGETRLVAGTELLEQQLQDNYYTSITQHFLSETFPEHPDESSAHWLITDGASERVQNWARQFGIDRVIQVGALTENVAVSQLSVRRDLDDDSMLDVLVSITNTGTEEQERQLELTIGDQLPQTTELSIAPGQTVHWQTRGPSGVGSITAALDADVALSGDDSLTIAADVLRPLATNVAKDCGEALRAAVAAHPGLVAVRETSSVDLDVSCPRGSFPAAEPSESSVGRIRALVGAASSLNSTPVWLPVRKLNNNLNLPADSLKAAPWPNPVDAQQQRVLLQSDERPLVRVTPSIDGPTTTVDTVIDLNDAEFARQPEYAAFIATLVDAAVGRPLLDAVTSELHEIEESVIRPATIDTQSIGTPDRNRTAPESVTTFFLIAAVLVLLIDTALFTRNPWHQSYGAIAARVAVMLIVLAAMWERIPAASSGLEGLEPPPAAILAISTATDTAHPGDRIGVLVESASTSSAADVVLLANGQPVARSALTPSGSASFAVDVPSTGPLIFGAELRDRDSNTAVAELEQASLVNVARAASVLVVANTPSTFASSLRQGGWPLTELQPALFATRSEALRTSSMLVLDDVSADDLPPETWVAIENAVRREALGLLVLGGPNSFSLGGYRESGLEEILPVISEPPGSEPPANLMFLIDVSGSMDRPAVAGSRLEIARQAVIGTARTLRPIDQVGLMTFDVDVAERLPLAARMNHATAVEQSWPDAASGGTNLVPAMRAAIDKFEHSDDRQDLLVVLTDGYLSDDDLTELDSTLQATQVDVIALVIAPPVGAASGGYSIDQFIDTVRSNNGRAIRVKDMLQLPTLMRSEVEQRRPAAVTGPSELVVAATAPWLPNANRPTIDQYLLTRPRDEARVHLMSDRGDVIVASMNVGAGKVVAVMSGFAGWATRWMQSEGWPELAAGLTGYLATRDSGGFNISVDPDKALLVVDITNRREATGATATIVGPSTTVSTVELKPGGPGRLVSDLDLEEAGQYLVVVEDDEASIRYRFLKNPVLPADSVEVANTSAASAISGWQLWLAGLALLGFLALLVREHWSYGKSASEHGAPSGVR
jgi:hypothetical protein